jgi:trehalose 6-phosphate synthase
LSSENRSSQNRSSQNRRLIVVSNRLPVVLRQGDDGWELKPGSGGLVTALAPALSHRGGLWIGWPGVPVEPGGEWEELLASGFRERGYELVPVVLTQREVEGFYYGFANSVLWPLFHDMTSSCDFEPRFWYSYLAVNRKFAERVVEQTSADDFVWVQDYQLINVAELMRERHEERNIGFFLHIPFPPLDIFTKLPWRGQILGALLAYDLIGLQTPRDLRNFLSCLEHLLPEVGVGEEHGGMVRLTVGDRTVTAGAFPIGIDSREFDEMAREPETEARIADLRAKIGGYEIVLGVDRLDYTKGLPERLLAFANALERYPHLREKVILLQIVVPSRESVPEYQTLKDHLDRLVGQINGQHSTAGWTPIHYHYRSLARRDLISLYRLGRVGFVTSIKDGMNLVSKEYVASQADLHGVLVLSEFAGAAAQLADGAILVNPHDIEGMADALVAALELPEAERRERMERMRRVVSEQDIFWWVDRFLSVALGGRLADLTPPRDFVPAIDTGESWIDV